MPYDRERERAVDVYEQTSDLILIVEDERVAPSDDRATQTSVAEAITRDEERRAPRREP